MPSGVAFSNKLTGGLIEDAKLRAAAICTHGFRGFGSIPLARRPNSAQSPTKRSAAAPAPPHAFLGTQTTLPTICRSCTGTA